MTMTGKLRAKCFVVASMSLTVSFNAFAANGTVHKVVAPLYCENIEKVCVAAGFPKNGHKADNGMWKACMQPILNGQTVAGVTVDPADVKGCQALRAKKTP